MYSSCANTCVYLALAFWEVGCEKEAEKEGALKLIILSYHFPGFHWN